MTAGDTDPMNPRVLLIEDNKDVRKLFSIILSRSGMEVETIADGREAVERLESGDLPDAVVMDRMLPGLPGDVVLARMRQNERWAGVPIVIVSALRRRFDVNELLKAGATAYLHKPVDTRELVSTVRKAIEGARGGSGADQVDAMARESLQLAIPRTPAAREADSATVQ